MVSVSPSTPGLAQDWRLLAASFPWAVCMFSLHPRSFFKLFLFSPYSSYSSLSHQVHTHEAPQPRDSRSQLRSQTLQEFRMQLCFESLLVFPLSLFLTTPLAPSTSMQRRGHVHSAKVEITSLLNTDNILLNRLVPMNCSNNAQPSSTISLRTEPSLLSFCLSYLNFLDLIPQIRLIPLPIPKTWTN